jgi:hypothetical protein
VIQTDQFAFVGGEGIEDESDEWYTPAWVFRALGVEFDLDPCSPGAPPSSVPAKRHITKEWYLGNWLAQLVFAFRRGAGHRFHGRGSHRVHRPFR